MEETFKIGDPVCEKGNPRIKMKIEEIDYEKGIAKCSWYPIRKSKEKSFKSFSLDKITHAINCSFQKI